MVSVMFRGGAVGVVEATAGISERVVSSAVAFFVVDVLQSVAANVGTDVVVGATRTVVDDGNSDVVVG